MKSPNGLGRCEEVKAAKEVFSPSKANRSPCHGPLPNFITKFDLRCSDTEPQVPTTSPMPPTNSLKCSVPCMPRDFTAASASSVPMESRFLATISSGLVSAGAAAPEREVSNRQTTAKDRIASLLESVEFYLDSWVGASSKLTRCNMADGLAGKMGERQGSPISRDCSGDMLLIQAMVHCRNDFFRRRPYLDGRLCLGALGLGWHKEHVVSIATVFRFPVQWIGVQDPTVTKVIAVLIDQGLVAILQANGKYTQFRKSMQFVGLGNAVVVLVDPEQQFRVHRITPVDNSVSVAAVFRLVEFRQRQVSVRIGRRRLLGVVA